MFRGLSRSSRRQAFPHMNAGLSLPRAGLLFDIPNRYPFADRVGRHDGPPQLLQYIQGPVDLFSDSIEGGETVTSKQGTATVTVLEGKLSVGAGTLWSFSLSNGSQYEFGSGGWAWDVSGNDRPLSVPVAACVEGREFGSNWPDTVGWSESNGEFAVGVNESEGVGEYITNGVLVPALADKSGCCAYLSDTPLVSVMDSSPSAFFNGMDFRLSTYTGGPTYVPDHLGVLRSPGANRWAVQGMRLATTVADGAVLGPEMVINGAFDGGSGWSINSPTWTIADGSAILSPTSIYGATIRQNIGYVANTTIQLIADVKVLTGSIEFWISDDSNLSYMILKATTSGTYTLTASRGGASGILYIRTLEVGSSGSVDNISIKKIIPIYINTDESGNAILPSTPQKTVTYNTDWTAKTFAETFDKFDISDPLKAPGWLCEPVRTNKCTCRKANPVGTVGLSTYAGSTFSVVDDTAALTAAGLIGVCSLGKAYEVVIPTGGAVVVSGLVGNTNPHSASAFLRKISGSGSVGIGIAGSPKAYTSSASYVSVKSENITPVDTTRYLTVLNTNADTHVLRLILPQLEEGAFCTSPIAKLQDGTDPLTAITRAATVASFPTAGKIPVNNFAIRMIVVPRVSGQVGVCCFGSYVDSSNYTAIIVNPTSITIRKIVANVDTDASVSITHANGVPLDFILYSSSLAGMQVSVRSFSSSWGSFTDGAVNSTTGAKMNTQIAATYRLGDLNGAQFTGNISLFDCVPIPTGITDPMAWAKTHWGVA